MTVLHQNLYYKDVCCKGTAHFFLNMTLCVLLLNICNKSYMIKDSSIVLLEPPILWRYASDFNLDKNTK